MILTVNGIDLFYEKTGEGPPVLLLHGNGENHKIFSVLTRQLAENYTVYAIDSRDHGQSTKTSDLHYALMAEDVAGFIGELQLERPILYGFSDGGIVGLMLASMYPKLLSKLIISGANTKPETIRKVFLTMIKLIHFISRSRKLRMILTEPNITKEDLARIAIPVLVLAGEKDMVTEEDTRFITASITDAQLKILKGEGHASYIVNSPKLYPEISAFIA